MNELFLGIDLGTSGIKAAVIDTDDRVVAQATAALAVQRPQPGWSEQSPEDWWQATVTAVTALPAAARRAVRAIGLAGQMHGAVLLDTAGRPLRPAILWNDGRSARQCAELERREPRLRTITGNLAMPGFTAPKLLWVREHEPDVFARIAHVLLPKDYLRLRLAGDRLSDMSDAAGTLWLDVAQRAWSEPLLAATGLAPAQMPGLVEGCAPAGRLRPDIARQLGLESVVVAGGGGDNAASAVGCGVVTAGQSLLSLGTSGVLFVVTDRFRPNPERAAHAFCHALPRLWHQMSVMLSAASTLDWVTQLTGLPDVAAAAAAAERRGLQADTPVFLPYLTGERTPHHDADARGVFFRLQAGTLPADLVVAVLEGVAQGMREGLDALAAAGSQIGDIDVVGGGARLPYWLRLLAAALERRLVLRSGGDVGAALGAARLARLAAGADVRSVCTAPPVRATFEPDPALADLLRRRRPAYAAVYRQLQHTFKEYPA
ncbi:MAG: xylulokinase [Gammaproteobacteria bacterium]|nr:xylulokinase [Gammaproteobacteria bacterium]